MQDVNYNRLLAITALISAVIATVVGLGLSAHSLITPLDLGSRIQGLYADGWLAPEATVELDDFAPFVNYVNLTFDPWRPDGAAAEIHFYLCGDEIGRIIADSNSSVKLRVARSCSERKLDIRSINPINAGGDDGRQIAAQLKQLEIISPLGLPIASPQLLLSVTAFIFAILYLWAALWPRSLKYLFTLLLASASAFIVRSCDDMNLQAILPLAVFFTLSGAGCFLAYSRPQLFKIPPQEKRNKLSNWSALLIMLLGLSLRLYGIRFGLPENFHPDEVPKVNAIMRMVQSGTLNPEYFLHPSLLLYSTYAMNSFLHLFMADTPFQDTLVISGRLVSALSGTLSIYLVYLLGRELFTKSTGLIASFLLAVFPLHITCSRYLKEDALLVFMVLLSSVLVVRAVNRNSRKTLLFAGLVGGLSASSKYSGLLTAAIVFSAPWLQSKSVIPSREWLAPTAAALILFPIGFVIASPYSVLDMATFIDDFSYEKRHMERGHSSVIDAWSQYWTYYYSRALAPGCSWLVLGMATVMLGVCAALMPAQLIFVASAALLFYLPAEWIKAKPAPQPERYVLPCLPFIAILAAELVRACSRVKRGLFAVPLLLAAICLPLTRSVELASEIEPDTRVQMREWMKANLPLGSKVLVDWRLYSPTLPAERFQSEYIDRSRILEELDPSRLRASGFDYLLLSSLFYTRYTLDPNSGVPGRAIIRELFKALPVEKEIDSKYGSYGFHNPKLTLFRLK